jgi:hypothetical protein
MLDSTVVNFMLSISFGQVICPELSGRDAGPFPMIEDGNINSQVRANAVEMREANIDWSRLTPRGAFILPICIYGKDMLQGLLISLHERHRNLNISDFRAARLWFPSGNFMIQATRTVAPFNTRL